MWLIGPCALAASLHLLFACQTRRWAVPRRAFWRIMGQANDFPARDKRVAGGEGKGESSWMRK